MLRVFGNTLFGNVVGEAQTGMGKYARRYVKILCFFFPGKRGGPTKIHSPFGVGAKAPRSRFINYLFNAIRIYNIIQYIRCGVRLTDLTTAKNEFTIA